MTGTAAALVRLQRSAGNRAVTRSLRMVARYETPEHVDLGDRYAKELGAFIGTDEGKAWVKRYGLEKAVKGLDTDWFAQGKRQIGSGPRTLTPGQIIALSGDFYERWQDLAAAPVEEVDEIVNTIHKERTGQLDNANAAYEGITEKYRKNKSDHYLELAKRNTPHFTPGNRKQWRNMHVEALTLAKQGTTRYGADPGAAYDKASSERCSSTRRPGTSSPTRSHPVTCSTTTSSRPRSPPTSRAIPPSPPTRRWAPTTG